MWGFTVRGSWRPNINCNILTPLLWPSRCVFLVLLMLKHHLWTPIHQGSREPFRPGVAFPTTSLSNWLQLNSTGPNSIQLSRRTQLSYIIVRCPPDLWNRTFNHHQAEITVMQFTGHSLSVHQSMSVPWEFFSSSHFNSQFPATLFPLITAIRMCHFLPVHDLEWHFGPGRRPKILQKKCLVKSF